MPRVHTVKKARKDQGRCGKCGCNLTAGMSYKYTELKTGPYSSLRKVRCMKPGCGFKPQDLTTSEFWGRIYELQDLPEFEIFSESASHRDDIVSQLEEIAEECADKFNNMPEGLQQGSTGEQLQNRENSCRDAASELENIEIPEDDDEDYLKEDAYDNKLQEIKDEMDSALSNICD